MVERCYCATILGDREKSSKRDWMYAEDAWSDRRPMISSYGVVRCTRVARYGLLHRQAVLIDEMPRGRSFTTPVQPNLDSSPPG